MPASTPPTAKVMPFMPRARPRSFGGNTSVRRAALLTTIMAPPAPWTMRKTISWVAFCERPQRIEPRVKVTKPRLYIRTRPSMSAMRPRVRSMTVLNRM